MHISDSLLEYKILGEKLDVICVFYPQKILDEVPGANHILEGKKL